jgi:Cof subfamily protein (haloacid dehalogenase superfamily)
MTVKLVALDLDDTLLDCGLQISPRCIEAIQAVRRHGVIVTIATGRMFKSALPYARQLGIDVPLITYQGAWVKNSLSGEVLYYRPVDRMLTRNIFQFFDSCGVHYHSYFDDNLCMESLTEEGQYYAQIAGVKPMLVHDLYRELEQREPFKIMGITFNERMLLDMELALKNGFGRQLYITRSKPNFIEVMHREATKANALQVVAEHYGVDRTEVMAIGDSYNDLDMLEWAGLGIAMGNAHKEVKEAADYVTTSNEEEGVAEALKRFVLNN